jgi:hypothetical protein
MNLRAATLAMATAAMALAVAGTPALGAPTNPNACTGGIKIEPVADGTYTFGAVRIRLDVNEGAQTFAFASNRAFSSVVVKGGPGAITYSFSPAASSGTDLHAPDNPRSGKYYGLSHVCFFGTTKGGGGKGGK